MQQLALFSNVSSQIRTGSKPRKTGRRSLKNETQWDLWTHQPDQEKEMALFFLDIRNFTPFAEKHDAFDVIYIVKKIFSIFQNIIRIHRGQIIETTGDGFYAAFGFDRNVSEAVEAAVHAGMAILDTLETLNAQSFEKSLHQKIEVGIGVHVGKVATGNLHLGSKDHLVVMGYAVNVASRLQSVTKELNNNFIVSSAVFKALKNPPLHSVPVKINLKGVTSPCELHLLGKPYVQQQFTSVA
jgi:adenylate cyclase